MSKSVLEYCGQQPCRETIGELVAQRDALLAAAEAALPMLKNCARGDSAAIQLREAIRLAKGE